MKRHWALLASLVAFGVALAGAASAYSEYFATVPVVIAQSDLPAGIRLEPGDPLFKVVNYPRSVVSEQALQSPRELNGFLGTPILTGQTVMRRHISPTMLRDRVEVAVDKEHELMGITTTLSGAVGGALGPGSRVNVYAYCTCKERKPGQTVADLALTDPTMRLQEIEIVDIRSTKGTTLDPEPSEKLAHEQAEANQSNTPEDRVPAVVILKVKPPDVKAILNALERKEAFHLTLVGGQRA